MKKIKKVESKAIVLSEITLSQQQQSSIAAVTPAMFIKEKPGRGGKAVKYVEAAYITSRLNTTFSPAGWNFEILEQGQTTRINEKNSEGEVWVRGRITIIDHKKGYRVSKTQYGQHPIHLKVPIGDAFKSAASDCLKKCASMFGIAHDVYWSIGEQEQSAPIEIKKEKMQTTQKRTSISPEEMAKIKKIIDHSNSPDFLIQTDQKIDSSILYTPEQKKEIHKLISARVDHLDANQA